MGLNYASFSMYSFTSFLFVLQFPCAPGLMEALLEKMAEKEKLDKEYALLPKEDV